VEPWAAAKAWWFPRHGQGWQARVSAGVDPSTGERIVLHETVPIPEAKTKAGRERAEREAYKETLQPDAIGPPPAKPRPQSRPPTSEQMAVIVKAAWESSPEWGLYVWLSAALGARRGEVDALQWEDIDLDSGVVRLDENYVRTADGMLFKDTKTHQMRRVSIDVSTVDLLRQYRDDRAARLGLLGVTLTGRTWVFSAVPDSRPPRGSGSLPLL